MSWLITLWSLLALGFTASALLRLRRAKAPARLDVPVLLLRPVDAPTPVELENLAAPLPDGVEQVVLSPYALRKRPTGRWLYSDPPSANRKAGHLAYATAVLPTEGRVVVAVDADVRVDAELLAALVEPVRRGAALATAEPSLVGAPSLGAAALRGLLNHSHQNFSAIDAVTPGARAVCGKAMALGPAALEELPKLLGCIGEDLELARRLHARGEQVELAAAPARVPQQAVSLESAFARVTRWMMVLRAHRPGLWPFVPVLFACTLPLALLAALLGSTTLGLLATALVTARTGLSLALAPRLEGTWEWALGELLLLAAFVAAVGRRTVEWRGRTLEVMPGGHIHVRAAARTSTESAT